MLRFSNMASAACTPLSSAPLHQEEQGQGAKQILSPPLAIFASLKCPLVLLSYDSSAPSMAHTLLLLISISEVA